MITQKRAVYDAIMKAIRDCKVKVGAKEDVAKVLTPEARAEATKLLVAMFRRGRVGFKQTKANKDKLGDEKLLNAYISGLITNWLRKDERLNGTKSRS
jgi:hypothetical protein